MINVVKYHEGLKSHWNAFVAHSKNGTFLFDRNFMDYHADRFTDFSLLFYDKNKLIALLPTNIQNNVIYSHQGLTYGGFITDHNMKAATMLECFTQLKSLLTENGINSLIYKTIPYIYHTHPAEEDLYALFRNHATLFRCDISSTIDLRQPIRYNRLRRRMIKRARENNIKITEIDNLIEFHTLLATNLKNRHKVTPVHSPEELQLLRQRFPQNIRLFGAYDPNQTLHAVGMMFYTRTVAHFQCSSPSEEGRVNGAYDLLVDFLINHEHQDKHYFDFGVSTENNGHDLNEGLIALKEAFGGRAVCYNQYSLKISS